MLAVAAEAVAAAVSAAVSAAGPADVAARNTPAVFSSGEPCLQLRGL